LQTCSPPAEASIRVSNVKVIQFIEEWRRYKYIIFVVFHRTKHSFSNIFATKLTYTLLSSFNRHIP
jgi:hypothetical protein